MVAKTRMEISINVEVADIDNIPVRTDVLADKISKAIENIFFVEPIDIRSISISRTGRTNITPRDTRAKD